MKYMVSVMTENGAVNDVFTDFASAIAHFKTHCQEGKCAALYNMA